jgi:hypothetical protein
MIVGLKKRKRSKAFYELGLVIRKYERAEKSTYPSEAGNTVRKKNKSFYVIKTFQPIPRSYGEFEFDIVYKSTQLVEKICDKDNTSLCNDENCPHKFRCFSTRISLRDVPEWCWGRR